MRKLFFLFPSMDMHVGGNIAQYKFLEGAQRSRDARPIIYRNDTGEIDLQKLAVKDREEGVFFIHWGPDVRTLIDDLRGSRVVYVAHSSGWNIDLPSDIPIFCVSKNTQAYWGRKSPTSLILHTPNYGPTTEWFEKSQRELAKSWIERPFDFIVQRRKSSRYLMDILVPELQRNHSVRVIDSWVENIHAEMRQAKVYLYDSVEHWAAIGASEGFGLPPLEAMGQGCKVASSINDALSDYLDPSVNCEKIGCFSLEYDVLNLERLLESAPRFDKLQSTIEPFEPATAAAAFDRAISVAELFFECRPSARTLVRYAKPRRRRKDRLIDVTTALKRVFSE